MLKEIKYSMPWLSLERAIFAGYITMAGTVYVMSGEGEQDSMVGRTRSFAMGLLGFLGLYFWINCMPWAVRILLDKQRMAKYGVSGFIHIVSCGAAVILGAILIATNVFFELPLDPAHPAILVQGLLAVISMISSFFMFHLLPKLSKKFFRRFFVAGLTSLGISLIQVIFFVHYQHSVLGKNIAWWLVPFSKSTCYVPVMLTISLVNVLGALLNCADDIMEFMDRAIPDTAAPAPTRRSSAIHHGSTWNTIRSFIKSDSISKVTGRRQSFANTTAHEVVKCDWPEIFMGGSELTFAIMVLLATAAIAANGPDEAIKKTIEFYSTEELRQSGDVAAQYTKMLMLLVLSFTFYAGIVFPLSLVLKGKISAENGRFLIHMYSLMGATFAGFVVPGSADVFFIKVIGTVFKAFFLYGALRMLKHLGCPLKTGCGTGCPLKMLG